MCNDLKKINYKYYFSHLEGEPERSCGVSTIRPQLALAVEMLMSGEGADSVT